MPFPPSPLRLQTLRQWLVATPAERRDGVLACVERIPALDASIQAWVQVAPQPPLADGVLSGIPFGAKDIFETRGLSTEYGSEIYRGRLGTADAAVVRDLRRRGAVLLGKTVTTAFAYRTPAATRNPRNPAHTPGGSSSGSAAAVAAGMVPFALGTQTLGSVLRPASYCGVTGFKPTFGVLAMDGVLPCAPSLDTPGLFAHEPDDMIALWAAMGHGTGDEGECVLGVPDPAPPAEPMMSDAFAHAVGALRRAGAAMRAVGITGTLIELAAAARSVMAYEAARVHEQRFNEHGDRLEDLADLVREGRAMEAVEYHAAVRRIEQGRTELREQFAATPVILTPAATGPAPQGFASTGDPRMNAGWTALGTPAISIPLPVRSGLPLGLQLTADRGRDALLLQTAARIHRLCSLHF